MTCVVLAHVFSSQLRNLLHKHPPGKTYSSFWPMNSSSKARRQHGNRFIMCTACFHLFQCLFLHKHNTHGTNAKRAIRTREAEIGYDMCRAGTRWCRKSVSSLAASAGQNLFIVLAYDNSSKARKQYGNRFIMCTACLHLFQSIHLCKHSPGQILSSHLSGSCAH